jgi:hypothetical protein
MSLINIVFDPDKWTSEGITAAATASIAIFTIVLVLVTNRQAVLTKRSVRIAERALTELERPYLFILDYNWILSDEERRGVDSGWVYSS